LSLLREEAETASTINFDWEADLYVFFGGIFAFFCDYTWDKLFEAG
jgi:hypothetical protein